MRNGLAITASILILAACGGSSSDDPVAAVPEPSLADPALEQTAATFAATAFAPTGGLPALPNLVPTANDSGFAATFSKTGVIDRTGPFFQTLGINGRSCSSCHIQGEGWTITPRGVQERFNKTDGNDPIFRLVDGRTRRRLTSLPSKRDAWRTACC